MALRSFWAVELVPGKEYTTSPDFDLHVTQAVLPASAKDKERTIVTVKFTEEDGEDSTSFAIASLKLDGADSQHLDLLFDSDRPVTFTATGKNSVHLTGYLVPDNGGYDSDLGDLDDDDISGEEGEEVDDEEDEEDAELAEEQIRAQLKRKVQDAAKQNGAPAPKKAKQDEQKPKEEKPKQEQKPKEEKPKQEQKPKEEKPKQEQKPKEEKPKQEQKPQTPKAEKTEGGQQQSEKKKNKGQQQGEKQQGGQQKGQTPKQKPAQTAQ